MRWWAKCSAGYGTQKGIAAKDVGSRLEFRRGDDATACDVIAILTAKRLAAAVVQQEYERGLGIDVDLGVIAGVSQFLVACEELFGELLPCGDGVVEEGCGQTADGISQGVDIQHAMAGQERGDEAAKACPRVAPGTYACLAISTMSPAKGRPFSADESAVQSKPPSMIPPTGWLLSGCATHSRRDG